MAGLWWLFLIPLVLLPFGFIAMSASDVDEVAQAQSLVAENALKKIQQLGNGETIEWDLDPLPPSQEFIWIDRQVEVPKIIVDEETGEENTIIVNETVKEQVKTSEIYGEIKDRQTGDSKVCKIGHQCDIFGKINLYDPVTGIRLQPISLHYQIICQHSHHPVLICDNFKGQSNTIMSYPDSTFKVTFVPNSVDHPHGDYELFVRATSKFIDPDTGKQVEREGNIDIKVIE